MDQAKIGRFIAECRKKRGLTQAELAEILGITDRAVSKWENGKSMPDCAIMLQLCKELKITVNDLLCGEVTTMDNYNEKMEQKLLEMVKQKQENDKKMLSLEILIGVFSAFILIGCVALAAFLEMEMWLRITLIAVGFIMGMIGFMFALSIEQTAGYYECNKCKHKYVPSFSSVLGAMHFGRTRFMKCPKCGEFSWNKKVVSKDDK
ncbi:MAG: helix-turn-helix transcriptional regulator [Clostridia bacterium]|nr:helix-turn-helix transcriptional regulator [Clostridia bacterium]